MKKDGHDETCPCIDYLEIVGLPGRFSNQLSPYLFLNSSMYLFKFENVISSLYFVCFSAKIKEQYFFSLHIS